ncbi:hypothetical protein MJO28_005552 [Puccinia striiformis f. sp. tritici]|uniref:Uncharacterized protein n=2 Tax=Puccinia striiformis TaxID=27350 RepID=A0A2S4VL62_9BASI|nr:hypothetical protein MJO28_005552 [Puccinia striiformis f. sp. tritici]POW10253.1 hypothetical protein PSHT_08815 [Puccinia striiformis]
MTARDLLPPDDDSGAVLVHLGLLQNPCKSPSGNKPCNSNAGTATADPEATIVKRESGHPKATELIDPRAHPRYGALPGIRSGSRRALQSRTAYKGEGLPTSTSKSNMQFSKLMIVFIGFAFELVVADDPQFVFACDKLSKDGKPASEALCGKLKPDPSNPVPSEFNMVLPELKLDSVKGYSKNYFCEDSAKTAFCCHPGTATFDKSTESVVRSLKLVTKKCVAPNRITDPNPPKI